MYWPGPTILFETYVFFYLHFIIIHIRPSKHFISYQMRDRMCKVSSSPQDTWRMCHQEQPAEPSPCLLLLCAASQLWAPPAWILCHRSAHWPFLPLPLCLFILGLFGWLAVPGVYSSLPVQIETMTYPIRYKLGNRGHFNNLHEGDTSKGIEYTAEKPNRRQGD